MKISRRKYILFVEGYEEKRTVFVSTAETELYCYLGVLFLSGYELCSAVEGGQRTRPLDSIMFV